jgi:hypothetical protein
MPILLFTPKLKPLHFENGVVLESGKIGIAKDILYEMDKVRENQSLIHVSKFLNIERYLQKLRKFREDK